MCQSLYQVSVESTKHTITRIFHDRVATKTEDLQFIGADYPVNFKGSGLAYPDMVFYPWVLGI